MPSRTNPPADPATAEAIGFISGQLREINHTLANQTMKSDARDQKLAKLESVPDDIKDIKERLTALETAEHRREGATGLVGTVFRSPMVAWLLLLAGAAWAAIKGKFAA